MLDPQERYLLMEGLRPPAGFSLHGAIGTTFSLDLLSLLTVPLAFTFFDWEGEDGSPTLDPLALLEAIRRNAERISIFCQAGRISVPHEYHALFGYLEPCVVGVQPPDRTGVFHPKVWALRFVAPGQPVRYRLIVASRNLTFDRSWDTMLVLEGDLTERTNAFSVNHPLGDFFAALPGLAANLDEAARGRCELFQHELRRVDFHPPEGLEVSGYWPIGISGHRQWPFQERAERLMIISPFITENCLNRLSGNAKDRTLVTRPESAWPLSPQFFGPNTHAYVLDEKACAEQCDTNEAGEEGSRLPLSGLHAKFFVAEAGPSAHIWTGSANATDAAFSKNVEFLVELTGKKNAFGIDAILGGTQGGSNLMTLLQVYKPSEALMPDEAQLAVDKCCEDARRVLTAMGYRLCVTARENGQYGMELVPGSGRLPGDERVQIQCFPITLGTKNAVALDPSTPGVRFGPVAFESLTTFFAFQINAKANGKEAKASCVLNLPVEGMPEDRKQGILRSLLRNKSEVMRYLMLLLAGDGIQVSSWLSAGRAAGEAAASGIGGFELPLFETLVRCLHDSPQKLEQVARLVSDLMESEEGRELLPNGFDAIWEPIRRAWEGMRS